MSCEKFSNSRLIYLQLQTWILNVKHCLNYFENVHFWLMNEIPLAIGPRYCIDCKNIGCRLIFGLLVTRVNVTFVLMSAHSDVFIAVGLSRLDSHCRVCLFYFYPWNIPPANGRIIPSDPKRKKSYFLRQHKGSRYLLKERFLKDILVIWHDTRKDLNTK